MRIVGLLFGLLLLLAVNLQAQEPVCPDPEQKESGSFRWTIQSFNGEDIFFPATEIRILQNGHVIQRWDKLWKKKNRNEIVFRLNKQQLEKGNIDVEWYYTHTMMCKGFEEFTFFANRVPLDQRNKIIRLDEKSVWLENQI